MILGVMILLGGKKNSNHCQPRGMGTVFVPVQPEDPKERGQALTWPAKQGCCKTQDPSMYGIEKIVVLKRRCCRFNLGKFPKPFVAGIHGILIHKTLGKPKTCIPW